MNLKTGDKAPSFLAVDANGSPFDSKEIIGKKPVVIYFYPKDNTPGCTMQACGFRDSYEDFIDLGAEVIGVSSDTVNSHKKFTNQYKLPFILLSDSNKKIRKLFGVPDKLFGLLPGRVTYIINKAGIITMIFDSVMATKHIAIALESLKKKPVFSIYGFDYGTKDGTCVRDYVDVRDIAAAHLVAANATAPIPPIMNVGTGRGASVREIIDLVLVATNKSNTEVIEAPRRAGDPAFLCADVTLAAEQMGFKSKFSLEESIRSLF